MHNLTLLTLLSALSAPLQARQPVKQASLMDAADDYSQCLQDAVCPSKWDTGLRYGHCYTLTNVNGDEPMCRTADEAYMTGGRTCNLIFKASDSIAGGINDPNGEQLCKQSDDCDASAGAWIPNNGTWYLQDQIGRVESTAARANRPLPGIATTSDNSYLRVSDFTPAEASKASGLQVAFAQCMFGGCAHCIRYADGSRDKVGMRNVEEHKDWGTHKAFPGPAANPLNCLAFRFREVLCVPGVSARPVKV